MTYKSLVETRDQAATLYRVKAELFESQSMQWELASAVMRLAKNLLHSR